MVLKSSWDRGWAWRRLLEVDQWWVDFVVGFILGIFDGGLAVQRCDGGGIGLAVRQEWLEGELLCGLGF